MRRDLSKSHLFGSGFRTKLRLSEHLHEKVIGGFMATSRVVPMKVTKMKVAQVSKPGADFEIVERDIPTPDAGQVRIKVQAWGLPQRCADQRGLVAGDSVSPYSGTRSRGHRR